MSSESPRWVRHEESQGQVLAVRDSAMLDARRRALGLSHKQLAHRAGCSKSFVGFICQGSRSRLFATTATRFAEALELPVEALFEVAAS